MKTGIATTFLLLIASIRAFTLSTLFRPTKKQVDNARQRKNDFKPPPAVPSTPTVDENPFQLPELPDLEDINPITPSTWNSITSSVLGLAAKLAPKDVRKSSEKAARISVNRFPPQSVEVDLKDIPIVGRALSGTYAKVKEVRSTPSIIVSAPKDKLGAVQSVAADGNAQIKMEGLLTTNVDVQLEPNRPGVAPVQVRSPLIPKWPFGKRKSDWNKVSNLGNGETYFWNAKTGKIQYDEPDNV